MLGQETLPDLSTLRREPTYDAEFQHFLRGKEIVLSAGSTPKIQGLTVEQAEAVVRLSCLPAFKDLIAKVQADEVIVFHVFPMRNVVCEQLPQVGKPAVLTGCACVRPLRSARAVEQDPGCTPAPRTPDTLVLC